MILHAPKKKTNTQYPVLRLDYCPMLIYCPPGTARLRVHQAEVRNVAVANLESTFSPEE